jgi:hypothetical protein
MSEMRGFEPTFKVSTSVDPRSGVRLKEHKITSLRRFWTLKEMVETNLEDLGCGSITSDVATQITVGAIGADHHCKSVPAHDGGEALFQCYVAGVRRLIGEWDGVTVSGVLG